jgi:ATP phosphoribosyltransferase regulatory subunit
MEEKPQADLGAAPTRSQTRLSSASGVIDALGGTKTVADILGVGQSSVSNYRKLGFPARSHFILSKLCAERGLDVADAVFGGIRLAPLASARAAAAVPQTKALDILTRQGFKPLATPVLQPAAPFIDRMGEEMRRRLFTFTDPAGEQLCLRPDLTIPTALAYLAQDGSTGGVKKYAYEGIAFRYQSRGAGKPEEFTQAGIEIIGGAMSGPESDSDDATILRDVMRAVEALGVPQYQIRLNHFAMLPLFLQGLGLTSRAVARLTRAYHQSANFETVIALMVDEEARPLAADTSPSVNLAGPIIAGRSPQDIQTRIDRLREDANGGLTQAQAGTILRFLKLTGPLEEVLQDMRQLAPDADLSSVTDYWRALGESLSLDKLPATLTLSGGRKMAYYTGLAFELFVPALGQQSVIAAGGRYDDLLQALGAARPLGAVGGALALERVEAAAQLQKGARP